ncbi:hypothetical protein LPJ61_004937 [Coemansia biformis]|uniref:RING-type E3 ubiquitin transferase n=1 Tax=Coemansia biformis TaxID=1286918 RepID=A0A9W8CW97_9FUNG|nr:hypothetical protein LPJ61_004937 [Coemansia biformis]
MGPYTLPASPPHSPHSPQLSQFHAPVDRLLRSEDDDRVLTQVVRRVGLVTAARDGVTAITPLAGESSHAAHGATVGSRASSDAGAAPGHSDGDDAYSDDDDNGDDDSGPAQGLYPPSAMFKRQRLPEAAWEPDEATLACHQCCQRFTLFVRRHHCRRCGLVVCDSCSSKRVLLAAPARAAHGADADAAADDNTPLAQLAGSSALSTYWRFCAYRTCDPCAEVVAGLPAARADSVALVVAELGSSDAADNAYNIFAPPGQDPGGQRSGDSLASARLRRQSSSSIRICPVCYQDWAALWVAMTRTPGEGWQEAQERHIRECIDGPHADIQAAPRDHPAAGAAQSRPVPGRQPTRSTGQQASSQSRHSTGFLSFFERASPTRFAGVGSTDSADLPGGRRGSSGPVAHQVSYARPSAGVRYATEVLQEGATLVGQECSICFEDFEPGQKVARLSCFCTFHNRCISDWMSRSPACPLHRE